MADPRVLVIPVPTATNTTHFNIQFSEDRVNWTTVNAAGVTDIPIASLSDRKYTLDGINTVVGSTENRPIASAPPKWYRLRMKATTTYSNWLDPFVFPSSEDFVSWVKRHLKDPVLTGDTALLEDLDYMDHVGAAVKEFESVHPRILSQLFTMTAEVQTYSLPDDWSNDFSRILEIEYPVSSTDPKKYVSEKLIFWDDQLGKWRFRRIYPAASEQTRIYYTTRHARDGSSVPQAHFESVAMWAAGDAAEQIMAHKNQFGDVSIGADYVSIDPRIKQWGTIAQSLKRQARALWGSGATGVRARIPYYEDHGEIPFSVLSSVR